MGQVHGDVILNLQGDEPFIQQKHIDTLIELIREDKVDIGTLVHPLTDGVELFDYNQVKVVFNKDNRALYFSRQAIPQNLSVACTYYEMR